MTHKVHPIGYRLSVIRDWKSRWLDGKSYPLHAQEDYRIREHINKTYKNAGVESVEVSAPRAAFPLSSLLLAPVF